MIVVCNKCKRDNEAIAEDIQTAELEDLEIKYFECPYCLTKYVCFAADAEMRELVEQRKAVEQQLLAAHKKRFTAKTIQQYITAREKNMAAQNARLPKLKRRAERLLRENDNA